MSGLTVQRFCHTSITDNFEFTSCGHPGIDLQTKSHPVRLFYVKNVLINILLGVAVIVVVTILEFLITLPFGDPGEPGSGNYSSYINRELLLTALPAGITTCLLTWILKVKSKKDLIAKSIIWTTMLSLYFALIGLGNSNFSDIFRTVGVYVLLSFSFIGPIAYGKVKRLFD